MEHKSISTLLKLYVRLIGIVLILSGLILAVGGGFLISYGGSFYYLPMGIALFLSGVSIFTLRSWGVVLFALAYIATVAWALWEVGLDFWPLVPRLVALTGFAALVAFAYPSIMNYRKGEKSYWGGYVLGILLLASLGVVFFQSLQTHYGYFATEKPVRKTVSNDDAPIDWQQYSNTTKGTRFSGAEQITPDNIDKLKTAWTFRTGDIPENSGAGPEDQNTPLFIDNTLFVCTPFNKVIAIEPETGKQLWKYDPKITTPNWQRCRGLAYYTPVATEIDQADLANTPTMDQEKELAAPNEFAQTNVTASSDKANACGARIFMNTTDDRLVALDPATGKLCEDFGDKGVVDLKLNMGDIPPGYHGPTAPPTVAGEVVVVAGRVADNYSTGEPSGVVRAYSVHDGHLVWAWDPGNPETKTTPADGKMYTRGSVNVWATMAYDPKLDLIYAPTGNATPDFWAGERTKYDDEFNSSIVAIEAKTGKIRWKYQTVHHDLWDYDLPSQPLLYDIPDGKGGTVPALLQTAKSGEIFMLNRETGKPLAEVVEKPVTQGNVEGERYSKTQPFSVGMPSVGNQTLKESDMWGATPFDQLWCRIEFASMDYNGLFTPPGMNKTLQWPGSLGGMNWGSVSVDPTTDYMFINDMRIGLVNWMIPRKDISPNASGIEMGVVPQSGTPFGAMRLRFMSPIGVPCQAPPYGTMRAIDLKTRQVVWKVPVGTVEDTGIMGIPMHLPAPVGMPTLGGSLSTKSGLLFFAGTQDFYLRAYDSHTGKEVWKYRLPVGSQGTPITFISPKNGKQYIVLTASGARQSPARGDYVMAWELGQ